MWFIITKILHTADKSPRKEDQKLSVGIYNYLSKAAEDKLLKNEATSEKREKNELYILIHDSSKSYKAAMRCFELFSCPYPSSHLGLSQLKAVSWTARIFPCKT